MHFPSAAPLILDGLQGEPGREALRQVVANGEFFLLLLPDGSRLVHPIAMGERFPLNFGREVTTLNLPHAALAGWHPYKITECCFRENSFYKSTESQQDLAYVRCIDDDSVQVMAQLAGAPDRADWKKCMISPDEEASRTESFKAHFKPYDIMQ